MTNTLPVAGWRDERGGRAPPAGAANEAASPGVNAPATPPRDTGKMGAAAHHAPCQEDSGDGYPPPCCHPGGHSWVISEENDRSYCEYRLADGDA